MAHAASQLKKNRDLEINAEEETEKKKKHRKRSRDRKKKVAVHAGHMSCLNSSFFFLILVCSWHKGYIQAPFHMPCEVWIGYVNCEQMMEPLRQTPAMRGGRPGEVFSCGLGDAGLCGRCAALDIGRAGFHGTERCCEGVQGTFLSRAWSRLNGPAWLRFKAEAREGIFCTSRRAVSWKSSFCARTVSHVCVAQADLWP